jgi:hypothetical protein
MRVSLHWLAEHTGKHYNTVKKHLCDLERDAAGKLDSRRALQVLFSGDGNGVTHAEALRKLTIAREEQIREDIRFKLQGSLPIDEAVAIYNELIHRMQITLVANKEKVLSDETVMEVTDDLEAYIIACMPAQKRVRVKAQLDARERYNAQNFLAAAQHDLECIARQRIIDAKWRELHAAELALSKDPSEANTERMEAAMEAVWPNTALASIPERYRKLTHSE